MYSYFIAHEEYHILNNGFLPWPGCLLYLWQRAKGDAGMRMRVIAAIVVTLVPAWVAHAQAVDFMQLAGNGTAQQVQSAITAGADVNAPDKDGKTPLIAATFNTNAGVLSVLLKAGANVNARQNDGGTALMAAAVSNPAEVITMLLKAGARINDQDHDGGTPLIWAAVFNPNPDVILVLLKAGADAKAKTSEGKTAFDLAQENPKLKDTDALRQLQDASR
jgi:ankyrin repeat protein